MSPVAFIGIDVGTSACKTVLVDEFGQVIHSHVSSYPTRRTTSGEVTQRPADWLRAVQSGLRSCAAELRGHHVEAIAVTAPAHVAVLADEAGRPLLPALLAFDQRPAAAAARLRLRYGEELFRRTFVELTAGWTLSQLSWLRETFPSVWPRIRWLLTQKDWIRFSLTGFVGIDSTDAAGTAMMDQRRREWIIPICADVGLSSEQLPPILDATSPAGSLSASWARRTGLRAGIPFAAGATDTAAELLSVGAVSPGTSLAKIASTGTFVAVTVEPVIDRRLLIYPHPNPGLWYVLGATNTAATAYQWFCRTALALEEHPRIEYEAMDRLASKAPPGAAGVLFIPFLEGNRTPHWDPDLRGAFLGLSSAHGPTHLARAVLEGVCYAIADCRDAVVGSGTSAGRPFLGGGGIASQLWRDILIAVLGTPAWLVSPQGPAIGAAVIAAHLGSSGPIRPWPPQHRRIIRPRRSWAQRYANLRPIYQAAVERIAEPSHRLVEAGRQRS
jgi:xylulokinase